MPVTRRINVDLPLLIVASSLTIYGLAVVFSAGQTDVKTIAQGAYRLQAIWTCIGILGAFAVSRASVRLIEWMALPAYAFTLVLLVALLAGFGSGAGTATSTTGWLTIGGHRLGQPAELAKLTVVLMLARVLSQNRIAPKSMIELWKPLAVAGVPLVLIIAQGDLGTSIVFVGIFFAMLFWAGVEWQLLLLLASPVISLILSFDSRIWGAWFLALLALILWYKPFLGEALAIIIANVMAGVVAPLLWEHLKPYRQNRLKVFLDPSVDPRGSGYHVIQSRVAIGSGGWFGRGYLHGPQKRLAFLPEQYTDFIFAVVGEEWGLIGLVTVICLFMFVIGRALYLSATAQDTFARLASGSLALTFCVYVFVNTGMVTGLMPVVGVPLPFISYGGTAMVTLMAGFGILMSLCAKRKLVSR